MPSLRDASPPYSLRVRRPAKPAWEARRIRTLNAGSVPNRKRAPVPASVFPVEVSQMRPKAPSEGLHQPAGSAAVAESRILPQVLKRHAFGSTAHDVPRGSLKSLPQSLESASCLPVPSGGSTSPRSRRPPPSAAHQPRPGCVNYGLLRRCPTHWICCFGRSSRGPRDGLTNIDSP